MRVVQGDSHFRVKAIAGTHVVLMALDMDQTTGAGLRGFAIKRAKAGQPQDWLRGIKYFKSMVPNPNPQDDYSSRDQPFQTFLWSDYRADPGTKYDFTIVALYGEPGNFEERHTLAFSITTEPNDDPQHGVWFNRGIIASHAFETEFQNKPLTDDMVNNVSDDGVLLDKETAWLSRGLAEACLKYINSAAAGEALRVIAYEFTYQPILLALKRALARGVDVQIVFHGTDDNRNAIATAGLPQTAKQNGKTVTVLYPRTRVAIPHNKVIIKTKNGKPAQVWTGSTNFTDSGFYGQTNVCHQVTDATLAQTYLDYWAELSADPPHSVALANSTKLTPNPPNVIGAGATVPFYSPRIAENMLDWYRDRIGDASSLIMMTIPFNVADPILAGLGKTSDAMRFVVLEDIPTPTVLNAEKANRGKLAFSNGAIMGKSFVKYARGGANVTPIVTAPLDKWFVDEELARPTNTGHVFFVHAKVLLIDPLSDDPLVCSGSANFSKGSLVSNDENMLLIRGNKRVADIYMTEIDRIFRHFYARDVINRQAQAGSQTNPLELDPTDQWIANNFKPGSYKNNRRQLFFPATAAKPWADAAGHDGNPFADEQERADQARADRNAKAKARRQAAGGAAKTKPQRTGSRKHTAKTSAKKKTVKKKVKTAKKKTTRTTAKKKKKKTVRRKSAGKRSASKKRS